MSFSNGTQQLKSSASGGTGTNNGGNAPPPARQQPLNPPGRPQSYSYSRDSDRLLWEMRPANRTPNTTPVSTVLNSPDLTDLDTKLRYQHSTLMQHHQIKVGRSPVGSGGNNDSNNSTNPSSPTMVHGGSRHPPEAAFSSFSLLSDGEMVVFDDIDTGTTTMRNWRMGGDRDILGSSPVPSEDEDGEGDEEEDNSCASGGGGRDDERNYYDVDSTKIQRIIGGLTIAEYEGSPRRFGVVDRDEGGDGSGGGGGFGGGGRPLGMARPGFPKRVISPTSSESHQHRPHRASSPAADSQSELIDLDDDGDGSRLRRIAASSANDDRLSGDLNGHMGSGGGGNDNSITDYGRLYSSMPILEDGLSSGHASDTENNLAPPPPPPPVSGISIVMDQQQQPQPDDSSAAAAAAMTIEQESGYPFISSIQMGSTDQPTQLLVDSSDEVQEAIKDIKAALQKTKILPSTEGPSLLDAEQDGRTEVSPVWVPRSFDKSRESLDSDQPAKLAQRRRGEADTDLETDRLLGQQRLDDLGFTDEKSWTTDRAAKIRSIRSPTVPLVSKNHTAIRAGVGTQISVESPVKNVGITNLYGNGGTIPLGAGSDPEDVKQTDSPTAADGSPVSKSDADKKGKFKTREGLLDPTVLIEGVLFRSRYLGSTQLVCEGQPTKSTRMMQAEEAVSRIKALAPEGESQPSTEVDLFISTEKIMVLNTDLKEIMMDHALRTISYIADIGDLVVLMARRRFVPQDVDPGDPAASLVAATAQQTASTNVSTGGPTTTGDSGNNNSPPKKSLPRGNRTPKMICHVFESNEAQFIAQSIGQAFQVAYMEFLKANGIEDHSFMKEMDYQEVLNSQEIFGDELEVFAKKELQKEVVVPKAKGEILGVVIVESGWGSMLPTVVIANLASSGAAARCGQLNIGDQIIAINGLSLVGLPLSTCQGYIKNTKNQTAVKFTVVPCAPVVEVRIKRPNTKYQLGFSVQNGVICSLLRGGIAERGGVRVGHRIIEINNQSVVAVPHEKIVNLLATSVGEIHMKTMPTSMFRLLTGQENPVYI
nr:amyloid-beta A4 precursor protein-binding family A member 1-like isoform X1 [Aedes albopictus]XP_029733832.1 amyloid-beta A4 precursor protein-binding family A member 1-like isoform X1 [Aedes albopictus]